MTKKSRKMKWKGVALNHSNIDEYMKDLIEDTTGQYITQGVSFNKEDNFQMTLLKNSILAHGSFSGFVKNLLFAYFEKNGSIDDSVWQPNAINETEGLGSQQSSPPPSPPTITENKEPVIVEQDEEVEEVTEETTEETPYDPTKEEETKQKVTRPKPNPNARRRNRNANASAFLPK